MNINNTIIYGFLFLFMFLIGSCTQKKDASSINVIPVASTVGNYSVLNLSDYATEIRYIPLETNDAALISPINLQIIYENEKILVKDNSSTGSNCYMFDHTGKFCRKIGQRGQGPDDYLEIDISMFDNFIYLLDRLKVLVYDINGRLVENINLKSDLISEEYRQANYKIIPMKKDKFVMTVATYFGYYPFAFLFETRNSKVINIKEYPSSVKLDKLGRGNYSSPELGNMYRYKDEVRVYKAINDTIFSIDNNADLKEAFIIDLGKYGPTLSYFEGKEFVGDVRDPVQWSAQVRNNFKKYIFLNYIDESLNHLFFKFSFGNFAPEPFEFTAPLGDKATNFNVYSVYNKRTGELTLMRQPIKGKFGFKNDIDNGPIIFPHYLSSNNELVTFIQPDEFLEYYGNIQKPSAALKEIAGKTGIYDNPIVIVAKLK